MPDVDLLQPRVLNGVIQRLPPADGLLGHQIFSTRSYDLPVWEYDIVSRRRNIARPNIPNSPAHIVGHDAIGHMSGTFLYTREKKVFEPTTLRWLRAPGEMARANAEAEVLREMQDLRDRITRFHEFLFWRALAAGNFDLAPLGYNQGINYGIAATHMPTASTPWTDPTADIIGDLQDVKRIVSRDTDATLRGVFGNGPTLERFWSAPQVQSSLTEADRGRYAVDGVLTRFAGMAWNEYDRGYIDDFTNPASPTFVPYIPDGYIVLLAPEGDPFVQLMGPVADDEAPIGATGFFSKVWKEKDPSNRQILVESNSFPVIYQPDNIVIMKVF